MNEQVLRDLIAKWRNIGHRPNRPTGFIICADQLEAALAAAPPLLPCQDGSETCNPFVASCGTHFCTAEERAHHEGKHHPEER